MQPIRSFIVSAKQSCNQVRAIIQSRDTVAGEMASAPHDKRVLNDACLSGIECFPFLERHLNRPVDRHHVVGYRNGNVEWHDPSAITPTGSGPTGVVRQNPTYRPGCDPENLRPAFLRGRLPDKTIVSLADQRGEVGHDHGRPSTSISFDSVMPANMAAAGNVTETNCRVDMIRQPLPPRWPEGYFSSVRTLIVTALVLLACGVAGGCADRSSRPSGADASPSITGGPDPIVLRVSRDGGVMSAARYPDLDSTLWRSSSRVPALERILAFGAEDGYLAAMDTSGAPVRIDLRLGTVTTSRTDDIAEASSIDGGAIYALTTDGEITRYTPSGGDWRFTPTLPAHALYAQADGSLIVAGAKGDRAIVWRVRPPGQEVTDSLSFDIGGQEASLRQSLSATAGAVGDRVFFGGNAEVIAVRARDLVKVLEVDIGDPVTAVVATPSGDRMFVAIEDEALLRVVDRFEEGVKGKIALPGVPRALRMDPLGRVVLARGGADSVYVISLANDAVIGVVHSEWRGDLPLVLPDGAIATTRGDDVVFAHPSSLVDRQTITGGALQFWYTLRWNGFRPRAAGLDQPVQFRTSAPRDSVDYADSAAARDAARVITREGSRDGGRDTARHEAAIASAFTVSFAAVLDEKRARQVASRIRVDGETPRITTSDRAGKTLYRVVLGPYPTRTDAERVGKLSGQSYWIFEGAP